MEMKNFQVLTVRETVPGTVGAAAQKDDPD